MPVFRVVKDENYTTMSNFHLRDKTLSLKAKGLQSMLLSLPDEWKYSVQGLASICREGSGCVNSVLRELEQHRYLVRRRCRKPDGTLGGAEYWIYEKPQPYTENPDTDKPDVENPDVENPDVVNPEVEKPDVENPDADKPDLENPPQLITNRSKTKESSTEGERKAPSPRYGQYQNVVLSAVELQKLQEEFPLDWQRRIDRLSEYMASTGKTYRNHLATIRSWARRDAADPKRQGYRHENYQYEEGDSL